MKELVDQIKVLGAQFIENATAQAEKGNSPGQSSQEYTYP